MMQHTSDVTIELCPSADAPALMRYIDENWRQGHILARDEGLLRWQYDAGRLS